MQGTPRAPRGPSVLEDNFFDTEPLAASQGLQAYPSGDDVAPVLAIADADARLLLHEVEVLCRYGRVCQVTLP